MIQVLINAVDVSDQIRWQGFQVKQNLTNQIDTCGFQYTKTSAKTLVPAFNDDIEVYDGATQIFGGKILVVSQEPLTGGGGIVYSVNCVDHSYEMDSNLVSAVYEDMTVKEIIDDFVANQAPGFTTDNVTSTYPVDRIVFNQLPISTCLTRLANMLRYDWYVDEAKDIHFFAKETNLAPFDLTDNNGNLIATTLRRSIDGSQVVNQVKIRGGEYDGVLYTDIITVLGGDTKSFKLPYRFANLDIELDTGGGFVAQTVGIDTIDSFPSVDVLYNYTDANIRFENPLSDGDQIRFSGNPKYRVFAIARDDESVTEVGRVIEKFLREPDIVSNAVARKRANAELLAYADTVIDAKFATRTSGLRSGMYITLESNNMEMTAPDPLIIKTITFKADSPEAFYYQVDCISTKRFDLLDLLRKFLEPEPLPTDEAEVAEEIFLMSETLQFADEWEQISPYGVTEELLFADVWFDDAVDTGDLRWVYGYFAPDDVNDVRRMGRYNRDAVYQ